MWKLSKVKEIDTHKWKEIIRDLKEWLGTFHLGISGGEPLLRRDLLEIVSFAVSSGVSVGITTNGTLIDKSMADKLIKSGISNINISLESIKDENHDFLRGVSGAFTKTMAAISSLIAIRKNYNSKLKLCIQTNITEKNIKDLYNLLKWAKSNRLHIHFNNIIDNLDLFHGRQGNSDIREKSIFPKDQYEIIKLFDYLINQKELKKNILNSKAELVMNRDYYLGKVRSMNGCRAGVRNLNIQCDGTVKLCFETKGIGNALDTKVHDLWRSETAKLRRMEMKNCTKMCQIDCYKPRTLLESIEMYRKIYSQL
jgi:MoaA/NifB/PqqE/SkfB family radical SAM enzyme